MKSYFVLSLVAVILVLNSCARIQETAKVLWGSTTRALEEARSAAISKGYQCRYEDCYKEVLKIAELEKYEIFIKEKAQKRIVLMGVKGSINTTEVGVFFTELNEGEVKVEVASLSSNAKQKVADSLFTQLAQVFTQRQ